jgi:hypothetical protein
MRSSLPRDISSSTVRGSTGVKPTMWNTSFISMFLILRSSGELADSDGHMFTCGMRVHRDVTSPHNRSCAPHRCLTSRTHARSLLSSKMSKPKSS